MLNGVKVCNTYSRMLGNQESQGVPQDKLASHLEPDQEVAAVLGTGEGEFETTCRLNNLQPDS